MNSIVAGLHLSNRLSRQIVSQQLKSAIVNINELWLGSIAPPNSFSRVEVCFV